MCRVVKKNEHIQKNDSQGEPKSKTIASSSSYGDFVSTKISNEPLNISGDNSSHTSYQHNESTYSSPITSPHHVTPVAEMEQSMTETNPASFWVSPDYILDSSKVLNSREVRRNLSESTVRLPKVP